MCLHYSQCPTDGPPPEPTARPRKRANPAAEEGATALTTSSHNSPRPLPTHPPSPRPVDEWPTADSTFEEATQIQMRRIEARAYCADPGNINPVTLKGTQLVVRHLARIRERNRNITKHASDYPRQQSEATEIVRHLRLQGDPPLRGPATHARAAHGAGQAASPCQETRAH